MLRNISLLNTGIQIFRRRNAAHNNTCGRPQNKMKRKKKPDTSLTLRERKVKFKYIVHRPSILVQRPEILF